MEPLIRVIMLEENLQEQVLKSKVRDGKTHMVLEMQEILLLVVLKEPGLQLQQNGVITFLKIYLVMSGN